MGPTAAVTRQAGAGPRLADVEIYRRQGYLVLGQVFPTDEVAAWSAECDRLWARPDVVHPDNMRTHVLGSDREVDRLDPVIDLSPRLAAVAHSTTIRMVAGQLLGDEPLLFKDKLIFKPPGARGYRTHQDYAYWHWLPAPPDALLSVLVAVDAGTHLNGAVELCPGLHERLLTREGEPGDVDDTDVEAPGVVVETRPGDVVLFHSLTPHRSGVNRSAAMRRQLYLSYSAAAHGDLSDVYYSQLHRELREEMTPAARDRAFFL